MAKVAWRPQEVHLAVCLLRGHPGVEPQSLWPLNSLRPDAFSIGIHHETAVWRKQVEQWSRLIGMCKTKEKDTSTQKATFCAFVCRGFRLISHSLSTKWTGQISKLWADLLKRASQPRRSALQTFLNLGAHTALSVGPGTVYLLRGRSGHRSLAKSYQTGRSCLWGYWKVHCH